MGNQIAGSWNGNNLKIKGRINSKIVTYLLQKEYNIGID